MIEFIVYYSSGIERHTFNTKGFQDACRQALIGSNTPFMEVAHATR